MSKFRDGMIGPTLILFIICLVITLALSFTQVTTAEAIMLSEEKAAADAMMLVLSKAGEAGFTQITDVTLPDGVQEAYKANNGAGYVFKAGAKGFDGIVTFVVGCDNDGNYVGITMFDHNETPGLGTKIGADTYLEKYYGGADPDAVDAITGATRTSNALKNSLRLVNEAFELVKGV